MKPSDLRRLFDSTVGTLEGRTGDVMQVMATLRRYGLGPKAARTDSDRGHAPIVCDVHDQDLADCHRIPGRELCTGSPLATPSDPTGEAAVSGDRFAQIETEIIRIIERMNTDAKRLDKLVTAHIAVTQEQAHDDGEPGCVWHQRAGSWVPVHRTTDGATWEHPPPAPLALCSACYQHARRLGRPLTRREVEHHRSHGRWPRDLDPATGKETPPVYRPDTAPVLQSA